MKLKTLTVLALITVQVTFAGNYLFSKMVMQSISPLVWGAIRTAATTCLLFVYLLSKKKLNPALAWKEKKYLFLFSCLGVVFNQAAFLSGLDLTSTANSGLINTLIPVFTVTWVTLWKHERLSLGRWAGFFSALLGVLILQDFSHLSLSGQTTKGDLLTVLNALSYSWFLFLSPPFFRKYSSLWLTAWLFFFGSLGLGLLSIPQWEGINFSTLSSETVAFMLLGIVIGNLVPYLLISYVLTQAPTSVISQFIYLQALVAGYLGWAFLHEPLLPKTLIATAFIFMGLYLSITLRNQSPP